MQLSGNNRVRARFTGFTLVEMLATIAVLGILVAITIPAVSSVRRSAKDAACMSNLRQIATAINLYRADHKGLPPTPIDLIENTFENRSVWEYGTIKAVGLGLLQYNGYLQSPISATLTITGDNRSPIFHDPKRNSWAYSNVNWIDYSYLISGPFSTYPSRYTPVINPSMAVATDVQGGNSMTDGLPFYGNSANVAYADGSVAKVPYATYSSPQHLSSTFDRH